MRTEGVGMISRAVVEVFVGVGARLLLRRRSWSMEFMEARPQAVWLRKAERRKEFAKASVSNTISKRY